MRLAGRTIVVTGPAKGMGPAITLRLAREGAAIVMTARDEAAMRALQPKIEAMGCRVLVVPTDVTDDDRVRHLAERAAAFGNVDGLVNVAGVTGPPARPIWEHTAEDYRSTFDPNVLGTFLPMKHLLPLMLAHGRGSIVNIGGTFGFKGVKDHSLYGATKWALRGLTKSAALEAGPLGVRVNMVSPGPVNGPRLERQTNERAAMHDLPPEQLYAAMRANAALRRIGEADDIADAVLFLLSDESRMITGQDLLVDGGTVV